MGSAKTLSSLGLTPRIGGDVDITELSVDSRSTCTGALFAALPGSATHGARFAAKALDRGAAAILTDAAGFELIAEEARARGTSVVVVEKDRKSVV